MSKKKQERKTKIILNTGEVINSLSEFYKGRDCKNKISYSAYRGRVKNYELKYPDKIDNNYLIDAMYLSHADYRLKYVGGGRSKSVFFENKEYKTIKHLLLENFSIDIKTQEDIKYITSLKLKRPDYSYQDCVDELNIFKEFSDYFSYNKGIIYGIKDNRGDESKIIYIGSTSAIHKRIMSYNSEIKSASNPLTKDNHRPIIKFLSSIESPLTTNELNSIFLFVIEDDIPREELCKREQYYIDKYSTAVPTGFNVIKAANSSLGRGIKVKDENNESYPSITIMAEKKAILHKIEPHVIESRYRNQLLTNENNIDWDFIYSPARKHSKSQHRGKKFFRRWLQFNKKYSVCEEWRQKPEDTDDVAYERFYQDTNSLNNSRFDPYRYPKDELPEELKCKECVFKVSKEVESGKAELSMDNVEYLPRLMIQKRTHGKNISYKDDVYTLKELSELILVPPSSITHHMKNGKTIEEIIEYYKIKDQKRKDRPSASKLSRELNIPVHRIRYQIEQGKNESEIRIHFNSLLG